MAIKKAVILLYTQRVVQLNESLITCCKKHDLAIIEIICAKDEYDFNALQQLIRTISKQSDPIALIIDQDTHTSLNHILTWCMLGTLSIARLIDIIYVFQGSNFQSEICAKVGIDALQKNETDFLSASLFYFQRVMDCVKERFIKRVFIEGIYKE